MMKKLKIAEILEISEEDAVHHRKCRYSIDRLTEEEKLQRLGQS